MEALSLFDVVLEAPARPAPPPRPTPAAPPSTPAAPRGPRLLAVDGNSLAHRAFHAYGSAGIADASGTDRSGVYGFLALLAAIGDVARADALLVGFDCRESSDRRDRWPSYKAQRKAKDPALYALLDIVVAVLDELGVTVVQPPAWEADDVLGSAAAAAERAGWECVLATSDRDAFGLVSDTTTVLRLRSGIANAVTVDRARLRAEIGVAAEQYIEFAALCGDTSDNLPGVPGTGPARARALLAAYPCVADAVADPIGCRSVLGPGPGQVLIDDLATPESRFHRNVALMRIRRDLPIDVEGCRPTATPAQIAERCAVWGVPSLAARLAVVLTARAEWVPPTDADAPPR